MYIKSLVKLLIVFGLFASTLFAEVSEVLTVQQSNAQEIADIIQPLYDGKDVAIVAHQDKLLIRANEETMADIKQLVQQLDNRPQQLLVEVRQTPWSFEEDKIEFAECGVVLNTAQHKQLNCAVNKTLRTRRARDEQHFQVRVLSGRIGYLYVGTAIPVIKALLEPNSVINAAVDYKDIGSGVYIQATALNQEQARINISVEKSQLQPSGSQHITQNAAKTQLQVPFGKWVKMADTRNQQETTSTYRTKRSGEGSAFWLRAKLIE